MLIVHVCVPGDEEETAGAAACGAGPFERRWACATVIEALEAAAEVDGRVCSACLEAHGFEVAADVRAAEAAAQAAAAEPVPDALLN